MADAVQSVSDRHPNVILNLASDVAHTLASKVLHISLFTAMEWSSPEFQPAKVFHLAGRILEGKTSLPSLSVAQATTDIHVSEDHEEVAKRQARLAAEIITSLDAHTSDNKAPTIFYDLLVSAGAAYLSDMAAKRARERRGIRPDIVRMVNAGLSIVS